MGAIEEAKKYIEDTQKSILEKKKRNEALKKFKAETGLEKQELGKAFEDFYYRGIPYNISKPKKQSLLKRKTLKGKETQIMDAKSTAHKVDDRAVISTDMNVTGGLSTKDKKALRASVMKALDDNIKGGMINDDEPILKSRGRPRTTNIY
jgi:predicted HAD superfamily phosphohydrolase